MPSPKEKKIAKVNINNMSNTKETENTETTKKQELPDWVKEEKAKPDYKENYTPIIQNGKEFVTKEVPAPSVNTPELTFNSTSKAQDKTNKLAQNTVEKVASGEPITKEESTEAQTSLEALKEKYTDERMKALAQTSPDKFSTIATIMSALVTAATGGAIPFIPFNSITGNDQKIAYFNKINATYADQMSNLALDVNKLEQQRGKEATSTEDTLKNAQQFAKEEGARKTDADVYKSKAETENQKDLMALENSLRSDYLKLNTNQQADLMKISQDLENKSDAEALRYLDEEASSGKYSNEALKLLATIQSAIGAGKTPAQVSAATANAWMNVATSPVKTAGELLHGKK